MTKESDSKDEKIRELERRVKELEEELDKDYLTGLPNTRHYEKDIAGAWSDYLRYKVPYTLGLIDLDRFKELNDNIGHQEGDRVLQGLAGILSSELRRSDRAYRRGAASDEFLVLIKGDEKAAKKTAERIRKCFYETYKGKYDGFTVSLSLGLCNFDDAYKEFLNLDLHTRKDKKISDDTLKGLANLTFAFAESEMIKAKGARDREHTVGNRVSVYKPNTAKDMYNKK